MLGLNTTTQYLACHSQSPRQVSLKWLSGSHVEAETSPCSVISDLDDVMIFSSVWTGVNGIRKAEQSLPASNVYSEGSPYSIRGCTQRIYLFAIIQMIHNDVDQVSELPSSHLNMNRRSYACAICVKHAPNSMRLLTKITGL
jgi:hypothetical protein